MLTSSQHSFQFSSVLLLIIIDMKCVLVLGMSIVLAVATTNIQQFHPSFDGLLTAGRRYDEYRLVQQHQAPHIKREVVGNQDMVSDIKDQATVSSIIDQSQVNSGMVSSPTEQGTVSSIIDQSQVNSGMVSSPTEQGTVSNTKEQETIHNIGTINGETISNIAIQGTTEQGAIHNIMDHKIISSTTGQETVSNNTIQGTNITGQGPISNIINHRLVSSSNDHGTVNNTTDQEKVRSIANPGMASNLTDHKMVSSTTDEPRLINTVKDEVKAIISSDTAEPQNDSQTEYSARKNTETVEDVCTGYSNNQTYPFADTCHRYVECVNGTASVRACPGGLYFNLISRQCDIFEKSICYYMCPAASGEFGIPGDCHGYFTCEQWLPRYRMCPFGHTWSALNKSCLVESQPSCPMQCLEQDKVSSYPGKCNSYVICRQGVPEYGSCKEGLHFHSLSARCVLPAESHCTDTGHYINTIDSTSTQSEEKNILLNIWSYFRLLSSTANQPAPK